MGIQANPNPENLTPPPLPARPSSSGVPSGAARLLDSKRSFQPSPVVAADSKDQWIAAPDPRASSSQSLRSDDEPASADGSRRRTLLLIYIHGFYGNKQSFRSFPHHVHSYLRSALADTHAIHSKIYPRYKTYRAIEVARDNFSEWLTPHESPTTDVILVGHSMGGILAAEVVLMPNRHPYRGGGGSYPFKHRILGTISLDSPFLGLHPGIVVAGISSLFQSAPEQPQDGADGPSSSTTATTNTNTTTAGVLSTTQMMQPPSRRQTNDPHFDPPFWNDSPFREAPFIKRLMNFTRKHRAEGIVNATANHIISHLEYGGCLADYPALHKRYDRIRALEDVDDLQSLGFGPGGEAASQRRVRFVNYYTLSSGRPRKAKADAATNQHGSAGSQSSLAPTPSLHTLTSGTNSVFGGEPIAQRSSVSISVADYSDDRQPSFDPRIASAEVEVKADGGEDRGYVDVASGGQDGNSVATPSVGAEQQTQRRRLSLQMVDPIPIPDTDSNSPIPTNSDITEGLPPIPDLPDKPVGPDLDRYTDKDARRQVEREYKRRAKAYEKAVKDRGRAIREREKLIEKRRRKAQGQTELVTSPSEEATDSDRSSIGSVQSDDLTDAQQQQLFIWQQQQQQQQQPAVSPGEVVAGQPASLIDMASLLPPLTEATSLSTMDSQLDEQGERKLEKDKEKKKKRKKFCALPGRVGSGGDSTWVDVYMDGMDEVGAHCGLFFPGPHYDKLVGDVASRIIGWVQDDMTTNVILDLQREDAT